MINKFSLFYFVFRLGYTTFNWFRWLFIKRSITTTTTSNNINNASIFTTIIECNTKYAYSTNTNKSWTGIFFIWCNRSTYIYISLYRMTMVIYEAYNMCLFVYRLWTQYGLLSHFFFSSLSPSFFDVSFVIRQTSRRMLLIVFACEDGKKNNI